MSLTIIFTLVSRALKDAAAVIHESPSALQVEIIFFQDLKYSGYFQLRYLQTLNSISAEKNSTIIFPFPVDIFDSWMKDKHKDNNEG